MGAKKEKALVQLRKDFDLYANLVIKQLKILESILEADSYNLFEEKFKEIKKREQEINSYEVKISEDAINIIVLYGPVASELRQLMAFYRVSLNIEKIGDLVINIIRNIKQIDDPKLFINFTETIGDIFIISVNMVEKALFALRNNDMDYAVWTIKNDDMVDELHHSFIKKVVKKKLPNVKSQNELNTFINLMNIVSNIERIADSATNIAEAAIYSTAGKDVRHRNVDLSTLT